MLELYPVQYVLNVASNFGFVLIPLNECATICDLIWLNTNMVGISTVKERNHRGFTLLELLVVIVIIGLLAAYVGPRYFSQIGKSETAAARAQIEALSRALGTYRIDVGSFPSTDEGLGSLMLAPSSAGQKWNGPYLQKAVPSDPWGHPYLYRAPGRDGSDFDLVSLGKDGLPGGEGEATDISNH